MASMFKSIQLPRMLPLVAIVLPLLLLPNFYLSPLTAYNDNRLWSVMLLIGVALTLLIRGDSLERVTRLLGRIPPQAQGLLTLFFALGILSALVSRYPLEGLLEISNFLLLLIASLWIATVRQRLGEPFDRVLLITLLISLIMLLVDTLVGLGIILTSGLDNANNLYLAKFDNVRFFGQFQSWSLPLVLLPLSYLSGEKRRYGLVVYLVASGYWMLFFFAGSRGVALGIIVAFLLVALYFRKGAMAYLRGHMVAAAAGFAGYLLLTGIFPSKVSGLGVRNMSSSGRRLLWESSQQHIIENPLFGIGPMGFANDPVNYVGAHPHNSVLQIAGEWGLPATLALLSLLCWGFWCWIRRAHRDIGGQSQRRQMLTLALTAAVTTATVHSLFSGVVVMPISQLMMALICGWVLALYYEGGVEPPLISRNYWSGARVLMLVTLTTFTLINSHFFHRLDTRYTIEEAARVPGPVHPRYWHHGVLPDIDND